MHVFLRRDCHHMMIFCVFFPATCIIHVNKDIINLPILLNKTSKRRGELATNPTNGSY